MKRVSGRIAHEGDPAETDRERKTTQDFARFSTRIKITRLLPLPIVIHYITMSTPKPVQGNSDFTTFNIRHGFAEALVRGMRSSFLSDQDYNHLIQCETLEDVRLNLTETDYADSIADFNSLTPAMLQKAAVEKVGL